MFCSKCGTKNSEESKFCASCGNPIETVEENVNVEAPVQEKPAPTTVVVDTQVEMPAPATPAPVAPVAPAAPTSEVQQQIQPAPMPGTPVQGTLAPANNADVFNPLNINNNNNNQPETPKSNTTMIIVIIAVLALAATGLYFLSSKNKEDSNNNSTTTTKEVSDNKTTKKTTTTTKKTTKPSSSSNKDEYVLLKGEEFNVAVKSLVCDDITSSLKDCDNIKSMVLYSKTLPKGYAKKSDLEKLENVPVSESGKIKAYKEDMGNDDYRIIVYSDGEIYAPVDSSNMFRYLGDMTELDVKVLNTSKVENMAEMFYGLFEVAELDLSNFDTSNVKRTRSMFTHFGGFADKDVTLDVSNFDLSNVSDASFMFSRVGSNLKHKLKLNLGDLSLKNVTSISYMFSNIGRYQTNFNLEINFDMENGCTYDSVLNEALSDATDSTITINYTQNNEAKVDELASTYSFVKKGKLIK